MPLLIKPRIIDFNSTADFCRRMSTFAVKQAKLNCANINNQDACEIAQVLTEKESAATQLTYLDLSNNNIKAAEMQIILENLPSSIEEINLKGNILSQESIAHLNFLIAEKSLKSCLVDDRYKNSLIQDRPNESVSIREISHFINQNFAAAAR